MPNQAMVAHPADKPLIEAGIMLTQLGISFQAKRRMFRTTDQGEIERLVVFQSYPIVNVMAYGMNYIIANGNQPVQLPFGDLAELHKQILIARQEAPRS